MIAYKVVLLGEGRVGKTSILLRYMNNSFETDIPRTKHASYMEKEVEYNKNKIKLSIWDTAGQEQFRAVNPMYYREAKGAILVYDVTDENSFKRVKDWVKELIQMIGNDVVLIIAGNKSDLTKRLVSEKDALEYAQSINAPHIYTSDKNWFKYFTNDEKNPITSKQKQPQLQKTKSIRVLDESPKNGEQQKGTGGGCC
ncbi:ras-related protein rab-21 [Anaeramoeba ignava]|uniref:Ras-related protein rab-21 n=1 Tax=Anaeramoeba ignava TaxID=1746090 RepID=A0A9Q0LRG1_ANAIG|nr:ras-related protein rab-21 [Anaeramoeba ignava]